MLGFCPHTKRLVSVSNDAFDVDVICEEFKPRYKVTETETQTIEEDE